MRGGEEVDNTIKMIDDLVSELVTLKFAIKNAQEILEHLEDGEDRQEGEELVHAAHKLVQGLYDLAYYAED
jgi:hypothetical protein